MTHSARRISRLSEIVHPQSYLEIGTFRGETFNEIAIPSKDAVDPSFKFDTKAHASPSVRFFEVTSDEYFLKHNKGKKYDIIFLDGLHTFEQTMRDFCATMSTSHDRTVWLIDDVWPIDVFSAHPDQSTALRFRHMTDSKRKAWHGDVFKMVYAIHDFFPNVNFRTIKTGGNVQTVAWREPREDFTPRHNNLETITRLTYFDMYDSQEIFRFGTEDEVIEDVRRWAALAPAG